MATHPFHPCLPQDINDLIFEYIVEGTLESGDVGNPPSPALLTVNRTWYDQLIRYRYVTFAYNSEPGDTARLWDFLYAIVHHKENRFLVKNLRLTTLYLYEDIHPRNMRRVFQTIWDHGPPTCRTIKVPEQANLLPPGQLAPHPAQRWQWLSLAYLNPANVAIRDEWNPKIKKWYHQALYRRNKGWFEGAMRRVGFDRGPNELFKTATRILGSEVPEAGYQCPLIAVLVAFCPNLKRYLGHVWHSEDDRWMDRIMNYATSPNEMWTAYSTLAPLGTQPPLQKLSSGGPVHDGEQYPFVVHNTKRDYWRLPALKHFVGLSVTGHDSLANVNSTSKIEELMLNSRIMFQLQLGSWLRWRHRLRVFSIRLPADEMGSVDDPREDNGPRLWNGLFRALQGVQHQLEYLDIYQDCIYPDTDSFDNWFDDESPAFCPPLSRFRALRQLNIPMTLLAGWRCSQNHRFAQRLGSHLPPNIKTLGVYTKDPETLARIIAPENIALELVNMVQTAADNKLDCLVWDTSHILTQRPHDDPMLAEANGRNLYVENTHAADVLLCAGRETALYYSILDRSSIATVNHLVERARPSAVIPRGLKAYGYVGQMNHVAAPVQPPSTLFPAPADDGDTMEIDR